ncbi:alpha-glucosidase [Aliiroseovarius sediminilitoris]|uniref:Alpha-glucosidase n=1 Tax=Aliiroseovarius sediminilitoris TaxID=1173584 RepID=A0A1I0PF78_9RHOB|nr:alpha-amylase family glycosyl hydrolase [Aliiroseovarius sediminilitoris]SEW13104.1 alpha-glucosidase [Aliiroseovarius sediminilitoris]
MNATVAKCDLTYLDKRADWWRGAVIYQIYPRSFQDDSGDGVGDLRGITRRLPYIASLGVDAIWISPFFTSPMKDFGYDVSDYRDVDPMFGTLSDFDTLVQTAHGLGLKIMIDLVLSHSSDQHPWFVESRADRDNDKANWYVWSDANPDGTPPTNWLSIFGGSAWTWDARRCQYYMHNFLVSQPDLNFHEPAVQEALLDVARFWLERGVDGFRLDTINFYTHDAKLRDNPPLPPEKRNASIAPAVNPYNHQEHLYDKNRPETLDFLRKLRAAMDPYGAAAVGEVGDAQRGLEIMGEYTAGDDLVQMCYAFELLSGDRPDAASIADLMDHVARVAKDGWACWAYSNHDVMRHASRWNLTEDAQKLFATLLMCLRGSACIYQGEELGLTEAELSFDDLQDPYGVEFWPEFKGRDGCRTPMVWEASNSQGGFTTAVKPWLPVAPEHLRHAVAVAEQDETSLLHHYRHVIALRNAHPALAHGVMEALLIDGSALSFLRRTEDQTLWCAFNLSDEDQAVTMPDGNWCVVDGAETAVTGGASCVLGAWQSLVMKPEGDK